MKRHIQQPGVRQWAGDDLVELQAEPMKAIDGFFAEYGPCIIQGCQVADNEDGTYDISSGLLALAGSDVNGNDTFKVVPFSGIASVPLPVYFTLAYSTVERSYLDGQVKPIAYNYRAEVATVRPAGEYLELSEDCIPRFVDVIQCDASHRFFTDTERQKLKGIDVGANKYVHPSTHPASMISEDSTHKFMTQTEKNTLSSLGTNAALKDFSNVTTKSLGQNGYYKFPDGLIIQWGYQGMSGSGNITIYLPSAFYDTNYSIGTTFEVISSEPSLHVVMFYTRQRTYFSVRRRFGNSGEEGDTGRGFTWIAIGRWKQ